MNGYLYVTSPIPPSVNHYLAVRSIIKNGKPISTVYKTKESEKYQADFKNIVREAVKEQGWETDLENPRHFYVDGIFYMDKKRKDANNLWKCLLDAVTETKLLWVDDDIVCERVDKILYDSQNPRVELCIHYVDYIGIFDNEEQLENFKNNNCIGCKRYKRNCRILANAVDGKNQEEIKDGVCSKCSANN